MLQQRSVMDAGVIPGQVDSEGRYVPTAAERTAYQAARIPWADQVVYGYYTLGFLCGLLVVHTILNGLWKLRVRYSYGTKSKVYVNIISLLRMLTYPQLPHRQWLTWIWTFGPLGPNILLFAGLIFATGFTFINEYYYYPPFYGSAPLYLRSEWIAMATLPFIYVLGSKRNIISVLTGVSHEKLQVLHQGSAFNFTYMSLVHTIAACIRAIRERGLKGTLAVNEVYVSGFVALAPLLILFAGALPPFRKSFYESFYWIHIIMAVFFAGAMFWHGYQTLDSDAYMIAAIALFLTSATTRLVLIILNNPVLHRAHVELVDNETIKMVVPTLYISWSAGQHVFIRFMGMGWRSLDSHPFTIANSPLALASIRDGDLEKSNTSHPDLTKVNAKGSMKGMVFLLKPLSGFTKDLYHKIKSGHTQYKVLIDGPYGDAHVGQDLKAFDRVLILTGGTGITWALSVLQDLVYRKDGNGREITLVWAVKKISSMKWFERELQFIRTNYPNVHIQHYVTGESLTQLPAIPSPSPDQSDPAGSSEDDTPSTEKQMNLVGSSKSDRDWNWNQGRPNLPNIIERTVATTQGSLAIATCGPPQFLTDCSNAVTKAQIGILTGGYPDVNEVYLKSESYGW
ncbi:hypothetical protein V865_002477 [Kwoniella europaea PYCC6329]|uniref:FAD-binding FR-type domain-containing protein n=1 Tax=Kwoniella europaea PYCC6329 TaxID=1423913 RepID=A0AAX4KEE8_9TREE